MLQKSLVKKVIPDPVGQKCLPTSMSPIDHHRQTSPRIINGGLDLVDAVPQCILMTDRLGKILLFTVKGPDQLFVGQKAILLDLFPTVFFQLILGQKCYRAGLDLYKPIFSGQIVQVLGSQASGYHEPAADSIGGTLFQITFSQIF